MSTLGANFVAAIRPTTAEIQAAFTAWFNANVALPPGQLQIPNPGLTAATPLTFAQIQAFLAPAAFPVSPAILLYSASQTGTAGVALTMLFNNTGQTPIGVSVRTGTGDYSIGFFLSGNRTVMPGNYNAQTKTAVVLSFPTDSLLIKTYDMSVPATPALADGVLNSYPILIYVY